MSSTDNEQKVVKDGDESDEDEDMTLAEREEWLRSRGVLIENPGDRAAPAGDSVVQQLLAGLDLNAGNEEAGSVPFVFVPHDSTKPLQTLHLPASVAQAKPGDALPDWVKPYFASDKKTIDASLLKEQATKHFVGGDMKQLADAKLSPAAMNAVAAQGSVETFPLVHPADTNQFQGVYIYLDEVGMLKKLPHNARASQIAEACGYSPAPNFYGDIFLGRVQTKPVMTNVGFVAGVDTDRGAAWMQRAISENLAWQQEMNQVTGKMGQTQPGQIGTDGKAAVEDQFEWMQDDDELEIVVPSETAWDKKGIKVSFLSRSVKVKYSGEEKLSLALYGAVDVDGCTWTIDGGKKLVITCEKVNSGEMWPRIQS
jgi:hypothetical protein